MTLILQLYNLRLDVSHITNTLRHILYKIQKLGVITVEDRTHTLLYTGTVRTVQ